MVPLIKISRKRTVTVISQLAILVGILAALEYELIGNLLPMEYWRAVLVFLIVSLISNIVRALMISAYRKRQGLKVGERDNFVLGIDSAGNLFTIFLTFLGTLFVLDIPFQTFLTSFSLVAVALVLIFRDYISNYLDSFRLMFSTDYKIGNYVKVGENSTGVISDISFRATKLKTDEGDVLFIPNTRFMTSEVVNYSKVKYKRITVPFSLPTETVHPVSTLEAFLREHLLEMFPDLIQEKKIFLRILNIKEWHTDFALEVSVDVYNFPIEDKIVKEVYSLVLQYQSQAEPVNIPSPRPVKFRK